MLGKHVIKHWSSTQSIVSLSSGEAEYYGCVRAGSQSLGFKSLLKDLGLTKKIKVKTDASVAKSMASRRGLGGVKHLEVSQLWLQEKVNNGDIEIEKVRTDVNIADALTKFKDGISINKHKEWTSKVTTTGRHPIMPTLSDPLDDFAESGDEEEQL